MFILTLGLAIFLGAHSVRMIAPSWRKRMIAGIGEGPWKGFYSLVSIIGFTLIVWGFSLARQSPVLLYVPPSWLMHLNALFTLIAFALFVASFVPANHIKQKVGHPMLAGVMVWAFGHLLAIGFLHDVVLFGAFLLWAMAAFITLRRRDRNEGVTYPVGTARGDIATILIGFIAWAAFAFWLHVWWIGMKPF